jgi:hypothetical protein
MSGLCRTERRMDAPSGIGIGVSCNGRAHRSRPIFADTLLEACQHVHIPSVLAGGLKIDVVTDVNDALSHSVSQTPLSAPLSAVLGSASSVSSVAEWRGGSDMATDTRGARKGED